MTRRRQPRSQPYRLEGSTLNAEQIHHLDEMLQQLFEDIANGRVVPLTTEGDLLYFHLGQPDRLAVGANATVLRSNGVDPAWGKIVLTTDVTGVLPVANGGTNSGTALPATPALIFSNGTALIPSSIITDATGQILDMVGIAVPATPASGHMRQYAATSNGHTLLHHIDQDGSDLTVLRDNILLVRNTSGSTVTKGQVVDIYSATGQIPNVRLADNSDSTKHGEAVMQETVANNGFGLAVTLGYVQNIDTSAFADGTLVYLSTAGNLTSTVPSAPAFVQRVGVIVNSHATQGILFAQLILLTATGVVPEPLTNGDAAAPELIFDSLGDVIMVS